MSAPSDLRLTNADLESMPDDGNRYELIEGELYVSSAPGFLHQTILANLVGVFLEYQREHLRNLPCKRIQCDEIWTFVGKKQAHRRGNACRDSGRADGAEPRDLSRKLLRRSPAAYSQSSKMILRTKSRVRMVAQSRGFAG